MTRVEVATPVVAITDGIHGGVESTGGEIIDYLTVGEVIPGICPIWHMHPEAVRKGVRYIGNKELGTHFIEWVKTAPVNELDRDQVAARRFMDAPLPEIWLGLDPHDSPAPRANSLQIGDSVSMTQLGVAGVMGIENVVVLPDYPFLRHNSKFVIVETERSPLNNYLSQPKFWKESLIKIVELGQEGMAQLGSEIFFDLNFFIKAELLRVDDYGNPDQVAINLIRKLEGIAPIGPYFTPVDPSHPVFEFYPGLQPFRDRIYAGYWDDINHSPERPVELGVREVDERPRREAFGSLLLKIAATDFVRSGNQD